MASFLAAMNAPNGPVEKTKNGLVLNEKGAVAHGSTGKNLLDLYSKLVRGVDSSEIKSQMEIIFEAAIRRNDSKMIVYLIVMMFQKRNCREGEGERDIFYKMFITLFENYPETVKEIVLADLIGHYGYYKDYFNIIDKIHTNEKFYPLVEVILAQIAQIFITTINKYKDDAADKNDQALLFKWLPREGSSFDKRITVVINGKSYSLVKGIIVVMRLGRNLPLPANAGEWRNYMKAYRSNIKLVMPGIDVPEVKMCARNFMSIDPAKISARANMIYRKAFLNKDKSGNTRSSDDDRTQFAEKYLKHVITKGIKGSTCQPHELMTKMNQSRTDTERTVLLAQWNDLRKTIALQLIVMMLRAHTSGDDIRKMIVNFMPVSDVSGSMAGIPMDVSTALGVFFSDFTHFLIDWLKKFVVYVRDVDFSSEDSFKGNAFYSNLDTPTKKFISDTVVSIAKSDMDSFCSIVDSIDKSKYLTNMAIAFHERPFVFNFSGMSPLERYSEMMSNVGYTTNFKAVHEVLLTQCKKHAIPLENIPTLIVFTDGQFDEMNTSGNDNMSYLRSRVSAPSWTTCHEELMKLWVKNNYTGIPDMVYWNLRAHTPGFNTLATHPGVQMVSGFSPAMMRSIMLGQSLESATETVMVDGVVHTVKTSAANPWDTFVKTMDDPIYDPVRTLLNTCSEGLLSRYSWTMEQTPLDEADSDPASAPASAPAPVVNLF